MDFKAPYYSNAIKCQNIKKYFLSSLMSQTGKKSQQIRIKERCSKHKNIQTAVRWQKNNLDISKEISN